jgi:RTX calcium-binding nonapeptide repeat (4 copies)
VASSVLAVGGRPKSLFDDLSDAVGWDTWEGAPWDIGAATAWPAFSYVYDLRTGSMLDVRALAATDGAATDGAAIPDGRDADNPDIEQVSTWAYLRAEDALLDRSSNAKFMTADGLLAVASVFANQERLDSDLASQIASKLAGLDNWPPAGWNGFSKLPGEDVPQSASAPTPKLPVPAEEVVEYATKLIGTDDDDVIDGTLANDFFNGLEGDDVLNGGPGDDAFHFSASFGQDVVIGFAAGAAGDDVLEFAGGLSSFDEVMAASLQVGPNVLIEVDDENGIALVDVALSSLNQDDFRFV